MLCGARRASILTRINSISAHSSCSFWTRLINMLSSFPRNGFATFFLIRNQRVPFIECRVFSPRHFFRIHSYKVSRSSKALHFRWGFIIPGNPIILSLSKLSISGASSNYCYPGSTWGTWSDTTLQNRWPGDIRTAMRATSGTGRGMTMMLGMRSCYCVACRGPIRNTSSPILIHLSAYGLGCSKILNPSSF